MLRARVESSNIATIGYDEEQQILEIVFNDGRVYHYLEVPPERALSLLRAESKGRYLNSDIKPNFSYRAVGRRWG
jgi:KTSC domain